MSEAKGHEQWGWARALPDRLRLPLQFDAAALAADFARLEAGEWTAHFVPENYAGEWDVLPLRAPRGASHPILRITSNPGTTAWDDTEFLAACPAFRAVLDAIPAELTAARLMRLGPGSEIREHRDEDLAAEHGMVRLHAPVLTNSNVDFRVNGRRVDMAAGELWYLRLADPHRVTNAGTCPRVHLVVDCVLGAELAALLCGAAGLA